jgi:hypothetical protein
MSADPALVQPRRPRRPRTVLPTVPSGVSCAECWGQRYVLEPGPLGLVPVICAACSGRGNT